MKVTIVPIVIGAFRTITKGSSKDLEDLEVGGRVETIQMTTLLRTARILRRALETWGDCHSKSSEKPSANADVKNSKKVKGCPRGVMVKAMDCGIVECEFVLQSRYYIHFRANTFGKGMNPLILPAMG